MSPRSQPLATLMFTQSFLENFLGANSRLSTSERKKVLKALQLLDADEKHPSLELHQLAGDRRGQWASKAGAALRLTFERLPDGRKLMLSCTHHYA